MDETRGLTGCGAGRLAPGRAAALRPLVPTVGRLPAVAGAEMGLASRVWLSATGWGLRVTAHHPPGLGGHPENWQPLPGTGPGVSPSVTLRTLRKRWRVGQEPAHRDPAVAGAGERLR